MYVNEGGVYNSFRLLLWNWYKNNEGKNDIILCILYNDLYVVINYRIL